MSQKRYQCFKANLCYMLKEFSILLKIYTGTLIVPPSFDTVHHFLSQITNFVVTCIKEEDTLFTKYRPTRGMNIHIIYNYLKHNICLTKTKIQ
jgi:hypothetical protein